MLPESLRPPARFACCRVLVALCAAACAGFAAFAQEAPPDTSPDASLAASVPASAGMFVELRSAGDLLLPLTDPQAWLTLSELFGLPARDEEADQWSARIQQTIGMNPVEAVRTLFSRRVAFAAAGLRGTPDGVILCTPDAPPQHFLSRWNAQPAVTTGRSQAYMLPNHIGLAVAGNLLVFGDPAARGLFQQIVGVLDDGVPTLAADETYQRLLTRVPPTPTGVFFARLAPAPATSQPADPSATLAAAATGQPILPRLLQGARHVLLALHRDGPRLHFSVTGDGPPAQGAPVGLAVQVLEQLPARTVVAWAGRVNYDAIAASARRLPERHVLRVAYEIQSQAGALQRFTATLAPIAGLAVGVVGGDSSRGLPPLPAVALLLPATDPATAAAEWRTSLHATVALYKLMALQVPTTPRLAPIEKVPIGDVTAELLDLTPLVSQLWGGPSPVPLHLCWALDGDVLIVASHINWLRQILAARHSAEVPRLGEALSLSRQPAEAVADTAFVAQPGPLADLAQLWLAYLAEAAPAVMHEDWWRARQPGGGDVRLGLQVAQDEANRLLRVNAVNADSPAAGLLLPGDELVGVNRVRFTTEQPLLEILAGLRARPDARWVDLLVMRDGAARVVRVPLPFVDPLRALRRIAAVGRLVQRVVYRDDVGPDQAPRGYLTLELRTNMAPLFDFGYQAPSEAVASQPASPPTTQGAPPEE